MASKNVFSEADYNSNDGMMTYVWGPALWHSLHTIAFNYPVNPTPEQKKYHKDFVMSLQHVLPCGACRKNLKKNLQEVPLTSYVLKNRSNFSRWMYRLHEHVNTMLGKKSGLSYEDVRNRYEGFRARCGVVSNEKEKGCTEPIQGIKSKCIIRIVPKTKICDTFKVESPCKPRRI